MRGYVFEQKKIQVRTLGQQDATEEKEGKKAQQVRLKPGVRTLDVRSRMLAYADMLTYADVCRLSSPSVGRGSPETSTLPAPHMRLRVSYISELICSFV